MSDSSLWVTCGTFSQARCRCGPDSFLMRGSGLVSTGPNLEKSTAGISGIPMPPEGAATAGAALGPFRKLSTSSLVIRPLSPLPFSLVRSTPNSRATRRTPGLAWTWPKSAAPAVAPAPRWAVAEAARACRGAGAAVGGGDRLGRRRAGHRDRLGLRRRLLLADQRGRLGHGAVAALEHQDRRALADLVADLDQDLPDRARRRRRHLHGRLVGLQRQQRVLGVDRVALLDQDLDDRNVLEVPDVGHRHLGRARGAGFGHGCHLSLPSPFPRGSLPAPGEGEDSSG